MNGHSFPFEYPQRSSTAFASNLSVSFSVVQRKRKLPSKEETQHKQRGMDNGQDHSPTLFGSDDDNAIELVSSMDVNNDEEGERIVEEADLSWGALRHSHKDHYCYRKRKTIALCAFSVFMIALLVGLVTIAGVVIDQHGINHLI